VVFAQTAAAEAQKIPPSAAPRDPAQNNLVKLADQFDKSPDTVVADVNGAPITLGMVADRLRDFSPSLGVLPARIVYRGALDDLIQQRALAVKARELGTEQDAATRRRIAEATDHELAQEMVRRIVPELVTEQAIRDRYAAAVAGRPGPEEVQFRVISTATESDALDVLAALGNGADFGQLARERSRDPSAVSGGEIGFARRDLLTPEIGAVAFCLMPGQTSAFPVLGKDVWFIIQVEARRQQGTPALEGARPQIVTALTREAEIEILRKSRAAVTVQEYGVTGLAGRDVTSPIKSY